MYLESIQEVFFFFFFGVGGGGRGGGGVNYILNPIV
jgi:hypothetical protein